MKINRLKLMLQMLIIKIFQVLFVMLRLMLTLTTKGTYFQMLKLMLEPIVMKMQLITNFRMLMLITFVLLPIPSINLMYMYSSCLGLYSQYGSDHNILTTRTGTEILGATGNSELCRKFSGDPLLFESWHIRVCQEIINKNVMPNSALEYIVSQTSGKPKEVVISMAGIEFQTSWSLKHIL